MSEKNETEGPNPEASRLTVRVYDELRDLADRYLRREGGYHTLQPTALVHEAYLRMVGIERVQWSSKTHFFAVAARQMRRVLVDHARAAVSQKRGGRRRRVTLNDGDALTRQRSLDLLALEEALGRLAERSPRQARAAELRLFAGMGAKESGLILRVSERTARDDWNVARAWLSRELRTKSEDP
jgi:RNA polymerase sigma factor (TIGR02999 family)